MKVFLTGGTGLIGSHVAQRLRERGADVVCLQRPSSDTTFLRFIGCEIVEGDVRDDPEAIATSMAGCDALIHGAALIYARMPWPKVRAVNVRGTENVLRAGATAGIARAVHISSVAVYGDVAAPVDEKSPRNTPLSPRDLYSRSKREAEDAALAMSEEGGLEVCIVRPSAVYGERDRLFAPGLAPWTALPFTPLLGDGRATLPVVYAGNVADAVVRAVEREGIQGEVFNLGSDDPVTQRDLFEGLARGMGRTVRFLPIPESLVRWGAHIGDTVGIRPPRARDLSLSRLVTLSTMGDPFRSGKARVELDWSPPHAAREALERTGAWLAATRSGSEVRGGAASGATSDAASDPASDPASDAASRSRSRTTPP